ncbi:MAG: hypothetical protein Tsb0021_03130 [Chlamydiales bacterium]
MFHTINHIRYPIILTAALHPLNHLSPRATVVFCVAVQAFACFSVYYLATYYLNHRTIFPLQAENQDLKEKLGTNENELNKLKEVYQELERELDSLREERNSLTIHTQYTQGLASKFQTLQSNYAWLFSVIKTLIQGHFTIYGAQASETLQLKQSIEIFIETNELTDHRLTFVDSDATKV